MIKTNKEIIICAFSVISWVFLSVPKDIPTVYLRVGLKDPVNKVFRIQSLYIDLKCTSQSVLRLLYKPSSKKTGTLSWINGIS